MAKDIKADTQELLNDTSAIREDTAQILAEIARLQEKLPRDVDHQNGSRFMLERYLDNLTTYAETVCHTFPDEIDDSKGSDNGSIRHSRSVSPESHPSGSGGEYGVPKIDHTAQSIFSKAPELPVDIPHPDNEQKGKLVAGIHYDEPYERYRRETEYYDAPGLPPLHSTIIRQQQPPTPQDGPSGDSMTSESPNLRTQTFKDKTGLPTAEYLQRNRSNTSLDDDRSTSGKHSVDCRDVPGEYKTVQPYRVTHSMEELAQANHHFSGSLNNSALEIAPVKDGGRPVKQSPSLTGVLTYKGPGSGLR
jgi:hypothetical protein